MNFSQHMPRRMELFGTIVRRVNKNRLLKQWKFSSLL